jgi:hypothetical protein
MPSCRPTQALYSYRGLEKGKRQKIFSSSPLLTREHPNGKKGETILITTDAYQDLHCLLLPPGNLETVGPLYLSRERRNGKK